MAEAEANWCQPGLLMYSWQFSPFYLRQRKCLLSPVADMAGPSHETKIRDFLQIDFSFYLPNCLMELAAYETDSFRLPSFASIENFVPR